MLYIEFFIKSQTVQGGKDNDKTKKRFFAVYHFPFPRCRRDVHGVKKQGISIMAVFWLTIALATGLNFGWLLMLLPILWFYSFFNVHNLKPLTEEEFIPLRMIISFI